MIFRILAWTLSPIPAITWATLLVSWLTAGEFGLLIAAQYMAIVHAIFWGSEVLNHGRDGRGQRPGASWFITRRPK